MRLSATVAFSLPLLLATSVIASQQCTCEPDNAGGGQIVGQEPWTNWDPSAYESPKPKPIKKVPKVTPTEENLTNGAVQAVQQLTNQNVLPPGE